jgi:hypothetical protein
LLAELAAHTVPIGGFREKIHQTGDRMAALDEIGSKARCCPGMGWAVGAETDPSRFNTGAEMEYSAWAPDKSES